MQLLRSSERTATASHIRKLVGSDQPELAERAEGRREGQAATLSRHCQRLGGRHPKAVVSDRLDERCGARHQQITRQLRAVLRAGEDAMISLALSFRRRMRIVIAMLPVFGNLSDRIIVGVAVMTVAVAAGLLRTVDATHLVGMSMVPAAPEQTMGDEGCRRQNGENGSEHVRNSKTEALPESVGLAEYSVNHTPGMPVSPRHCEMHREGRLYR